MMVFFPMRRMQIVLPGIPFIDVTYHRVVTVVSALMQSLFSAEQDAWIGGEIGFSVSDGKSKVSS